MTDWDGMSEDEIQRWVKMAVAKIRAVHEAKALAELEQAADEASDYSWPPAPNSEHPWLERAAPTVRRAMAAGKHEVAVAPPRKPLYRFISEPEYDVIDEQHEHLVLDIRRCAGFAPFVGDPFIWMWKVAVDKHNRWVAGDSWREPVPPGVHVALGRSR